jgi:hypothetical protein
MRGSCATVPRAVAQASYNDGEGDRHITQMKKQAWFKRG